MFELLCLTSLSCYSELIARTKKWGILVVLLLLDISCYAQESLSYTIEECVFYQNTCDLAIPLQGTLNINNYEISISNVGSEDQIRYQLEHSKMKGNLLVNGRAQYQAIDPYGNPSKLKLNINRSKGTLKIWTDEELILTFKINSIDSNGSENRSSNSKFVTDTHDN